MPPDEEVVATRARWVGTTKWSFRQLAYWLEQLKQNVPVEVAAAQTDVDLVIVTDASHKRQQQL